MWQAADLTLWSGRSGTDDVAEALRWHQCVTRPDAQAPGVCLLGFACDVGVRRNHGRVGASQGPVELRRAMGNLAMHGSTPLYDAGDVVADTDLEAAQLAYAQQVSACLRDGHRVIGLGGGHEIAWGAWLGLNEWLTSASEAPAPRVGIINFDAHFDLRPTGSGGSSGTPFRQIAEWCAARARRFDYLCLGISEAANTRALFDTARQLGVEYLLDVDCQTEAAGVMLERFIAGLDQLYVTVCLDALPAAVAPGVSAPAALGIPPDFVIGCLRRIHAIARPHGCQWRLADIAELNPRHDIDGRTARTAARLAWELHRLG